MLSRSGSSRNSQVPDHGTFLWCSYNTNTSAVKGEISLNQKLSERHAGASILTTRGMAVFYVIVRHVMDPVL
jgi:hypothetical protein